MDISLIETLRWEPETGFVRLERHLARLERSAEALGLAGAQGARAALMKAAPTPTGVSAAPPSALPGISPARGEIGKERSSLFSPAGRRWPEGPDEGESETPAGSPPSSPRLRSALFPDGEKRGTSIGISSNQAPSPLRVRLELFADGRIEVKTAPFVPLAPDVTWTVRVASTRLDSSDRLLRHKTSRRAVYETARGEYPASEADEVILLNEHGEVCEGTISSVFVDDGSGLLRTPPLACGLLAGVLREELLDTGLATEERLSVEDLRRRPVFVGNSLRGLIAARLA